MVGCDQAGRHLSEAVGTVSVFFRPADGDGEWQEVPGEVVEMTFRIVCPDGVDRAPAGACPECARLPFGEHVAVCPHGVAVSNDRRL